MRFERRTIVVRSMNKKDVENYYYQFPELNNEERTIKIAKMQTTLAKMKNEISSTIVLVVEEKDTKKIIGAIFGRREHEIENIYISIPNRAKLFRYGYEVVDQFKKICAENWPDISKIKFDRNDQVAQMYLKEKGLSLATEFIHVTA